MPSAEDAIRARMAAAEARKADDDRKERELVAKLMNEFEQEAKRTLNRLEVKKWPGGELLEVDSQEPILNWRGKQKGTRSGRKKFAAWKLLDIHGDRWSSHYYMTSEGKLYVTGNNFTINSDILRTCIAEIKSLG